MNSTGHRGPRPPQSGEPPEIEERDWIAQERALMDGDRRDALLALALRTLPVASPPPGFAAEMARLVAPATREDDERLDRLLLNALLCALALGTLVVALVYGGDWLALADRSLGAGAMPWALAGAACVGLSWALGGASRLFAPPPNAAA
ncbi:MAG: hypothetical protein KIS72_05620 [Luteimonas sp.]|nr:hypothetical protein [Luteimonas sp.]